MIYTISDIYALPDGERAELIDGQIYYMAPPGRTHQKLSMFLSNEISAYIRDHDGSCEVYAAPFAVFLSDDDLNYVEPDISVICEEKKLDEKGCHGAPDWVIEIVSPASRKMDYYKKLFQYRMAGIREYWVVDPDKHLPLPFSAHPPEAHSKPLSIIVVSAIPIGRFTVKGTRNLRKILLTTPRPSAKLKPHFRTHDRIGHGFPTQYGY